MKNLLLLSLLFFSLSTFTAIGQSQPDPAIFPPQTFVWCGIDFSKARLIDSQGFSNPHDIQARYFDQWNMLMLNEQDKYNFRTAYSKPNQITDFSVVTRRNQIPDAGTLVINQDYAFEDVTVENVISDYDLADHDDGLGLVYVGSADFLHYIIQKYDYQHLMLIKHVCLQVKTARESVTCS